MRIPTYERKENAEAHHIQKFQVSNQTPDTRLQVNADMFGGAQARAMGQAGHDLQRAGMLGVRAAAEWEDTKAQAAMNAKAAEDAEALYGENGIFNLKGEAAVDAPAKLQKYMAESERKYADQAGGSWGQSYFKQRVERQTQQLLPRAMQHATLEKQNFEVSTHLSRARLNADEALRNAADPELFSALHAEGLVNITLAGRAKGKPDEEIEDNRRKYSSQLYMGKVQGLLTAGKIGEAQKVAGSGFLMGEDGLRAAGMIRSEQKRAEAEARANAAESRREMKEKSVNSAYRSLYSMSPEEAQAAVMNPEWQQSMGLTADMARDAGALLHTMRGWEQQTQKHNREKYEADLYTKTTNMVLGVGGHDKDPVKAMETIQKDTTLDGKTKMEMLNAVQNNLLNTRDDANVVNDLTQRIIDTEGAVPDSEILQGVATGKVKQTTAENLMKLREMTQGGNGVMVKNAFSALNEMFRKSMMADGTPEHAAAHLAAQRQLQSDIDGARESGNRKELERVTSPEYIMVVGKRFALSMQDQQRAVINRLGAGAKTPERVTKFEDGISSSPVSGMKVRPSRNPGESIEAYRKRVGME